MCTSTRLYTDGMSYDDDDATTMARLRPRPPIHPPHTPRNDDEAAPALALARPFNDNATTPRHSRPHPLSFVHKRERVAPSTCHHRRPRSSPSSSCLPPRSHAVVIAHTRARSPRPQVKTVKRQHGHVYVSTLSSLSVLATSRPHTLVFAPSPSRPHPHPRVLNLMHMSFISIYLVLG